MDVMELHKLFNAQGYQAKQLSGDQIPACAPPTHPEHCSESVYKTLKRCLFLIHWKVLWWPSSALSEVCLLKGSELLEFVERYKDRSWGVHLYLLYLKNSFYLGTRWSGCGTKLMKTVPKWKAWREGLGRPLS